MGTSDLYVRYEDGFPVGCMTAYEWARFRGCSVKAVRDASAPSVKRMADEGSDRHAYYVRVRARDVRCGSDDGDWQKERR